MQVVLFSNLHKNNSLLSLLFLLFYKSFIIKIAVADNFKNNHQCFIREHKRTFASNTIKLLNCFSYYHVRYYYDYYTVVKSLFLVLLNC